jgi:hypothetical protein
MGCLIMRAFSRSIIEIRDDHYNFFRDVLKVNTLWKVLLQQAVGIFVRSLLPGSVDIGKDARSIPFWTG